MMLSPCCPRPAAIALKASMHRHSTRLAGPLPPRQCSFAETAPLPAPHLPLVVHASLLQHLGGDGHGGVDGVAAPGTRMGQDRSGSKAGQGAAGWPAGVSPAAQGHELALCNEEAGTPAVCLLACLPDPNKHSAPSVPDDVQDGAGAVLRAGLHQGLHNACSARKSHSSCAQSERHSQSPAVSRTTAGEDARTSNDR